MTVQRGADWGRLVEPPAGLVPADDDASVVTLLGDDRGRHVLVRDGDLFRTMGATGRSGRHVLELPIDLVVVVTDDLERTACAHVVARRALTAGGWWRGSVVVVMNAQFLGRWNVAPRGHPNDGRVEVQECDGSLGIRERVAVRQRLVLGTHLPHPSISSRSVPTAQWSFDEPMEVFIDGRSAGRSRELAIAVEPDAAIVYR